MTLTLAAMTLASSMILVDQTAVPLAAPDVLEALGGTTTESQWLMTANILPLAALMIFGGRLGDLFGLRRVFLAGAVLFTASSAAVGFAQSMEWAIAARAFQGCGAALMMPTALAIVSAVYPAARRGAALGILAGASAFFAAAGPVLGGALTSIDWRLVFLVNLPIAAIAAILTLRATPPLEADPEAPRDIDLPGVVTFGVAAAAFVFALSQGATEGWGEPITLVPLVASLLLVPVFVWVEGRAANPMLEFRLFRNLNFLAANLSQMLAGSIELGLGFLTPFFLLLVVGISPVTAGLALIPATIPIILAGPLAGKAFDRFGGRPPLVAGYLILAASGVALALGVADRSVIALVPGLVLQGLGLGIVLTVNDPVGLAAVPEKDQGVAAGTINTTEQLGGAIGIAALTAIELSRNFDILDARLAERGIEPTADQIARFKEFLVHAEQTGLNRAEEPGFVQAVIADVLDSHVGAFQLTYSVSAAVALAGAIMAAALVRRRDRVAGGKIFGRRSRWIIATAGRSPAITRKPPTDRGGIA